MLKKLFYFFVFTWVFNAGFEDLLVFLKDIEGGAITPYRHDLTYERRGDNTYVYGYPKGSSYYKDTLVIDLTSPTGEYSFIEVD